MMQSKMILRSFVAAILVLGLSACQEKGTSTQKDNSMTNDSPKVESDSHAELHTGDNVLHEIEHFFSGAKLVSAPEIVDCTLSGGTKTQCIALTVKAEPSTYTPGPWCPRKGSDGPDVSGVWIESGEMLNADGEFMQNLATFYKDNKWQMVDPETGLIKVTDTKAMCDAAARPDVGEEYENYCVECSTDYMDENSSVTYTIPLRPQLSSTKSQTRSSGSGIALNGVRLDGPAPTDAILGAYTVAPFDDCGGHVNLNVGYHYHAVTECLNTIGANTENAGNQHAATIGLAMDGYKILTNKLSNGSVPQGLDECNGHSAAGLDYHYHAGIPGSNAIVQCLSAETGCVSAEAGQVCDASKSERRGPPPGEDGKRPPRRDRPPPEQG